MKYDTLVSLRFPPPPHLLLPLFILPPSRCLVPRLSRSSPLDPEMIADSRAQVSQSRIGKSSHLFHRWRWLPLLSSSSLLGVRCTAASPDSVSRTHIPLPLSGVSVEIPFYGGKIFFFAEKSRNNNNSSKESANRERNGISSSQHQSE